ncbi:calcium-binding protein, partial [Acaryochloris marina NIES-2412]|uniref:calcium-binding protein n=1 Tax=Acaryochloris marina TaxID=155978 RepID=UPI00405A4592
SAITTILNDDAPPPPLADIDYSIATSAISLTEGNNGAQQVTFTVTRTGSTQNASSVDFTFGGTATNTEDFNNIGGTSGAAGLAGTINFGVDETSKTITLDVLGDTHVEPDETIVVSLANATAPGTATISTDSATTTILNDDFLNEDNDSDDDADESNENNSGDGEENTSSGKVLHGTHGHDMLVGMDGDDTIRGLRGDDLLLGRGGDDHIQGNGGEDTLKGGSGDDELLGGHGRDYLLGGDGHDLLRGGNGKDLLVGGAGSDTFVLEPGKGRDVIADFDGAVDKVSLMAEQLSFDDLKITSVGHSSLVSVASTGDQLAFFTGVGADLLNANVFMVIENPGQA